MITDLTGLPFRSHPNKFAPLSAHDELVFAYGALTTPAASLRRTLCTCGLLPEATPSGKSRHPQVPQKGSAMPSNDWATRHPELVHWLHQAKDERWAIHPLTRSQPPQRSSLTVCSRFL